MADANTDFEKALTANAGASGVSAIIAGKTEPNQTGSLGVTGKTAPTPETPPQTNEGWQGIEEWRGTKKQREALRALFDGKCAYCGNDLGKAMHADHLEPVVRITRDCMGKPLPADECYFIKPERNTVANMMPACAPCNLHKGGYSLEEWRRYLERSAEIVRKQTSTFRAGERFGIITVTDGPVRFYFERIAPTPEPRA